MQRLANHPVSKHEEIFIMKYRKILTKTNNIKLPKVCTSNIIIITYYLYIYTFRFLFFFYLNK